jgi:HPt (histidine-containing phosphotransfer) domain-containing protein
MEYKIIHIDFLQSFTNNDSSKMVKYIHMFLETAPGILYTMKMQWSDGDFSNLRTTAHSLKPLLGYMGISGLKEQIIRIEEYAGEGKKPEVIGQLIAEVTTGCQLAFTELEDLIRKIS